MTYESDAAYQALELGGTYSMFEGNLHIDHDVNKWELKYVVCRGFTDCLNSLSKAAAPLASVGVASQDKL